MSGAALHSWGQWGQQISLRDGGIDLWLAYCGEIRDERLHHAYRQIMSDAEREQERRFYFEADRRRYLVTRALTRAVLSRYEPKPASTWTFAANEYGRPEIANADRGEQRLVFNISHTDSLVVLAISRGRQLGVDVEVVRSREGIVGIADHYFAQSEVAALTATPPEELSWRFFEYWTFKESYIKARGMGLSLPLDGFAFRFPDPHAVEIDIRADLADDPARWLFWQFRSIPDHLIAVCAERTSARHLPPISLYETVPLRSERMLFIAPSRFPR